MNIINIDSDTYKETFISSYGEKWWYDFNSQFDVGILWGSDVDNKKYYVFDGMCPFITLDKDEKEWLRNIWDKYRIYKNDYFDLNLKDGYCPICMKKRKKFEGHHCIPALEGGSDDDVNILNICQTCHSIITSGHHEDSFNIYIASVFHQIMLYGIDFYKMNPYNNKRHKNDIEEYVKIFYETRPFIKKALRYYNDEDINDVEKEKINSNLKDDGKYLYKYHRGLVMGFINEVDYD